MMRCSYSLGTLHLFLCTCYAIPDIHISIAGAQSSLYVHRDILGRYSSIRSEHINLNVYLHMLGKGISVREYDSVCKQDPILTGEKYSQRESPWLDFIVDEKPPFVCTDCPTAALICPTERCPSKTSCTDCSDLEAIPMFVYAAAVAFNLELFRDAPFNPRSVKMTAAEVGKIFTMTRQNWKSGPPGGWMDSDTRLAFGDHESDLIQSYTISGPDTVHKLFTHYVSTNSEWETKATATGCPTGEKRFSSWKDVPNTIPKRLTTKSHDAALGTIYNNRGAVTYVNWMNIMAYDSSTAIAEGGKVILNGVAPNLANFEATLEAYANEDGKNGVIDFNATDFKPTAIVDKFAQTQGKYPLLGFSYIMMRRGWKHLGKAEYILKPSECSIAVEILRYIRWFNRDKVALAELKKLQVMLLPSPTYDKMIKALSFQLYCINAETGRNISVWDAMLAQIEKEKPFDYVYVLVHYVLLPVILIVLCAVEFWLRLKRRTLNRKVEQGKFEIPSRDIVFIQTSKERYREMLRMRPYLDNARLETEFRTGEYGFCVVLFRPLFMEVNTACLRLRQELIHMQEWRTHKNLVKFLGICEVHRDNYIVSELSLLGDLRTLLSNTSVKLTIPISFCMARGMAEGVRYLHGQNIIHGNLRSPSVYVESDWTIKISDWEYTHLYSMQGIYVSREHVFKYMQRAPPEMHNVFFTPLLWTAPEQLKAALDQHRLRPSKEADAYAAGIIFYEILTRSTPYKFDSDLGKGPLSLLLRVLNPKKPLRPLDLESEEVLSEMPESMINLMRACWHEDPKRRVTASGLSAILGRVEADTKRMADLTVVNTGFIIERQKSDIKTTNSEVKQRMQDLRKANEDYLTPSVYEKIKAKLPVEPKVTNRAYVLHLTMVEYTELLDPTHGESAIALIERFQTLISQHILSLQDPNIFRLHTSGDDCTIIAAVPAGGIEYADKIAVLALDLISITWKAVMLDIDTDHIKIRLGIHCGPVLSGLYGNDHSEFTVIGEARDIAEDMERLSATYRILITEDFLNDLKQFHGYHFIENTDDMRRHDKTKNFWLLGRDRYAEQESLDAIKTQYGEITTGRVPYRARPKSTKTHSAPPIGGAKPSTEKLGGSRRQSAAAHQAQKDDEKEAPTILERRVSGDFSGTQRDKSKKRDKKKKSKKRKPRTPGAERYLSLSAARSDVHDDDSLDILQMGFNKELIVVKVKDEIPAPYMATLDPTVSNLELPQLEVESSQDSIMQRPQRDVDLGSTRSIFDGDLHDGVTLRYLRDTSLDDEDLEAIAKIHERNYANPKDAEPLDFTHEFPSPGLGALSMIVEKPGQEGWTGKVRRKSMGVQAESVPKPKLGSQETQTSFQMLPDPSQIQRLRKIFEAERSSREKSSDSDLDETALGGDDMSNLPADHLPHSHAANRLRRRVKRKKHRPSIHDHAAIDNPAEHLEMMEEHRARKEAASVSPKGMVASLAAQFSQPRESAEVPPQQGFSKRDPAILTPKVVTTQPPTKNVDDSTNLNRSEKQTSPSPTQGFLFPERGKQNLANTISTMAGISENEGDDIGTENETEDIALGNADGKKETKKRKRKKKRKKDKSEESKQPDDEVE